MKSKEQNHSPQTKSASSLTGECESVHRELVLAKSEDKTADTQTPNEEIIEREKREGARGTFFCSLNGLVREFSDICLKNKSNKRKCRDCIHIRFSERAADELGGGR